MKTLKVKTQKDVDQLYQLGLINEENARQLKLDLLFGCKGIKVMKDERNFRPDTSKDW